MSEVPYTLVGGQRETGSMSPEIERCVDTFVAAYRKAVRAEIPNDNGARELVAKMAYEAQWQIEASLIRQLAHPKGLPA